MEGDGPIMGKAKRLGLVVVGLSPTAVDATCARVMGLHPHVVPYLALAGRQLGPIDEHQIEQRGEDWEAVRNPFLLGRIDEDTEGV